MTAKTKKRARTAPALPKPARIYVIADAATGAMSMLDIYATKSGARRDGYGSEEIWSFVLEKAHGRGQRSM